MTKWEVRAMSGIPEITGESQVSTRKPALSCREAGHKENPFVRAFVACSVRDDGGMTVSPLRMRLIDFSGEGERAPPGVRRPGQVASGKRR